MTIPAFQFWRLRVTSIEAGDLLKIDSMAFLGRSGGDNIATGGTALSDAGDASGAFTGGSAWRVGFGGESPEQFALVTSTGVVSDVLTILNWSDYSVDQAFDTFNDPVSLKFSPDGKYLALYGVSAPDALYIVDTSTWSVIHTETSPSRPQYIPIAWSPDSRYVSYVPALDQTLKVLDSQASWANVYTGSYTPQYYGVYYYYQIDWSPDGAYLAMANLDNDHPLVFDTSDWSHFHIDMDSVGFYVDMGIYTNGVQFSSDGTKLYIGWADSGYQHLAVINASTWAVIEDFDPLVIGETFQPPDSSAIYLSPDQNKIVFQNSANYGTTDIYYLCNISSGTPAGIEIIWPQGFAYPDYKPGAAWKADSSEFACVVNPTVGGNPRFYAINAETGAKTDITVPDLENVLHHSVDTIPTLSQGSWIGYKFAYPVTPTHIDITASGDSRPRSGVIEYSPDGRTWYALQTIAFS